MTSRMSLARAGAVVAVVLAAAMGTWLSARALAPVVTGVTPASGYNYTTTVVSITGSGFVTGATATIGSTTLTNVTVHDASTMSATVPANLSGGAYPITVRNPDTTTGSLPAAFTVLQSRGGATGPWRLSPPPFENQTRAHISCPTMVEAQGFVFCIVESGETYRLAQAPLTSDGTIGAWTTTTAFVREPFLRSGPLVTNGAVIWVVHSQTFTAGLLSWATVAADGTVGTWSTLDLGRPANALVEHEGFLYLIGGGGVSCACEQRNVRRYSVASDGTPTAPVETALPAEINAVFARAVRSGSWLFVGAGSGSVSVASGLVSAALGPDGSIGTWTSLPEALPGRLVATGHYVYKAAQNVINRAEVRADGTLGPWTLTAGPDGLGSGLQPSPTFELRELSAIGAGDRSWLLARSINRFAGAQDVETIRHQIAELSPFTLSRVSPTCGVAGATVALHGTDFVPGMSVTVGASAATDVAVANQGAATFVLPAAPPGTVAVGATHPDGRTASLSSAFTYDANQPITLASTSATAPKAGGAASVSVTTTSDCQWDAVSASSFITVTSVSPSTGSGVVTYTVAENPDRQHRFGFITIAGQTFTVLQDGVTLAAYPTGLRFTVFVEGGSVVRSTGTQAVTVQPRGGETSSWFAEANQPWLSVSQGSTTTLLATLTTPPTTLGLYAATITIRGAEGAITEVPVVLEVSPADNPPIGAVDTPVDGANGLSGAIAVAGWALDDVAVSRVELWRNCLETIDRPTGACSVSAPGGPSDSVFLGQANFLPGARPDVEALHPDRPEAYRAGWGYLLLTNALPNQTTGTAQGGQGPFTISAYAVDARNQYTLLGARAIVLNNANATLPFGAIDTPEQGSTLTSTTMHNFGWAMTRRTNALGDELKCIERSRYRVVIDGVARTLTPGANWFPNLSRSDLTAAYPGLCDSADALAAYALNTETLGLTNGVHTIGWDVYDDNGTPGNLADDNAAGIGSRFFTILIPGASDAPPTAFDRAEARIGDASTVTTLSLSKDRTVRARVGAVESPAVTLRPETDDVRRLRVPLGQRIVIDLGGVVQSGFEVVADDLRALPSGSTLDGERGHFYWQPPLVHFGTFVLAFLSEHHGVKARTVVEVTITDPTAGGEPEVTITSPRAGANPNPVITVTGTARDPRSLSATGINAVHVWAYRKDVEGVPPQFLGDAVLTDGNYTMTTAPLQPGTYEIAVFAWVARTGTWAPAATVVIAVR